MKKGPFKGYLAGFMTCAVIFSIAGTAMAAAYQKQATLDYTGIKITLDGSAITPTDATGNVVEPFAIEGTTYLPVRGIANALGLEVGWDQATQTVKLERKDTPAPDAPAEGATVNTVLVDQKGIKITYTGTSYDGWAGPSVNFLIENTTGKTYNVQARECSIDGYMINPIMSAEVASGKKANNHLTIMTSDMEKNGLTTIGTIELYFHIFASDDWNDSFDTEVVTINCK